MIIITVFYFIITGTDTSIIILKDNCIHILSLISSLFFNVVEKTNVVVLQSLVQ